jgi:hypothetical protein
MNAQDITFGVEIECLFPAGNAPTQIGQYHRGIQVEGLPEGWNSQRDGSLQAEPGFIGVEIVSPVLKGQDGLAQIKAVCDWLRSKGVKVNRSCGLHVHIGFNHQSARALAQLVCLVAKNEKALFAITGTKGREQGSYCKPIKDVFRALGSRGNFGACGAVSDRYHSLNLSSLANGGRPTVEFRCFAGTTNYIKIQGYVEICAGLIQKAINTKGKIKYDAPALAANSRVTLEGEGETAANRLFYQLFWKFGGEFRPTSADPKWAPLGVIDPDTIARSGKLLLKLARKYDGHADAIAGPDGDEAPLSPAQRAAITRRTRAQARDAALVAAADAELAEPAPAPLADPITPPADPA